MKLAIVTGTAGGLALIAFALLVSGCGGGGGGPSSPSGAVGPVAGRPLVSMPSACGADADAGVTSVEVASGEANACGLKPAAGYYGCCYSYGVVSNSDPTGESVAAPGEFVHPIPGGPADPCVMPAFPGDSPHTNCIEVPLVAPLSTDPRYVAGTISAQLCGANGIYSETNEQSVACCCYQ